MPRIFSFISIYNFTKSLYYKPGEIFLRILNKAKPLTLKKISIPQYFFQFLTTILKPQKYWTWGNDQVICIKLAHITYEVREARLQCSIIYDIIMKL